MVLRGMARRARVSHHLACKPNRQAPLQPEQATSTGVMYFTSTIQLLLSNTANEHKQKVGSHRQNARYSVHLFTT